MDSIHERRVIAHFGRHRAKQVADALLLLNIHVQVADHHDAAVGADVVLTAAKLARGHVAFHDVDAILLVK